MSPSSDLSSSINVLISNQDMGSFFLFIGDFSAPIICIDNL